MLRIKIDSKDLRTLYVVDKSSQISIEMMNPELNVTWIIHIYTKKKRWNTDLVSYKHH